ncbi:MAG TPA: GNAT family N-acetyltransferase [Usitatibacteraceae bacterium]|nr:GNAT family N-acetyltransferase [Usitatibacteraceae bacterium]
MPARYLIEPLAKGHDRSSFACGSEALDTYLRRQARLDGERGVSAPFVLIEPPARTVLGYYTLSASAVDAGDLPEEFRKKLPRYPQMPVTLLGRPAVDRSRKGKRLGELLLMDALHKSLDGAAEIAAIAVFVDAKDASAKAFYEHFDFIALPRSPRRLFLPMQTIARLFA